jgi:hypothetical protein
MSDAKFVPAIGEQFNHAWTKNKKYKDFDLKFFTKDSHFEHDIGLQCCYYGINGVNKKDKRPYREIVGWPDDKLLITDSAGFQVSSFMKKGETCNIKPIDSLRWQEQNADIAMNLDMPPTLDKIPPYSVFKEALDWSVNNFQFFQDNRKNYKMKLYNVLHGETIHLMQAWYDAVKHFNFDGWAVGMKPPWSPMIQAMGCAFLHEMGEFDKSSCYGLHFFGTSGKHVVPTIVYFASKLNDKVVTYDSSSYNIGSIYRTYYLPFDFGPHLSFGDKFKRTNPHVKRLPCDCPVCRSIDDINTLNGNQIYSGVLISLHNLYQYKIYNRVLNSIVHDKEKFIKYLKSINISDKTLKSIEFIDFAMEKGVYNAAERFRDDLIPQEFDTTEQQTIFRF